MNFPKISDIPIRRKSIGLTQTDLARLVGVSKSTIAKLEKENHSPSYDLVIRIFDVLESERQKKLTQTKGFTAKDLMTKAKHLVTAKPNENFSKVIKIMLERGVSQAPVIENGFCIGSINMKQLSEFHAKNQPIKNIKIKEIMQEPFPTITQNEPIETISQLLTNNQAILVTEKGKISGIISNLDSAKIEITLKLTKK